MEMRLNLRSLSSVALLAAITVAGCKSSKPTETNASIPQSAQPAPTVDASQFGTITGTAAFQGKPPARVNIDMSMDPACAMSGGTNTSEQYVINDGKLANVYVYIKAGAPSSNAPAGQAPVVLDQKGCKYTPHVIAVQQGGSVEFHNSDPTMHNIHTMPTTAGNQQVDVSQGPMGQPQTRQFTTPEAMMPVRCNNHPWMSAFLNVAPNPYFAVTGTNGKFEIHLPPGTYTLAAVQEKLGEQEQQIVVPAKGTVSASFAFASK